MPEVDGRDRAAARVLVVDDDDEMRAMLRRTLEFDGHRVAELDRSDQVLATLKHRPADLVILDKELPGGSGIDLLPALRQEHPRVPILFVTAFGGRQVASSALRLGATRYLEKPFRLSQLREAIDELLGGVSPENR